MLTASEGFFRWVMFRDSARSYMFGHSRWSADGACETAVPCMGNARREKNANNTANNDKLSAPREAKSAPGTSF